MVLVCFANTRRLSLVSLFVLSVLRYTQGPTRALRLAVRGGAGALRLVLERVRAVLCRGGAGAGAGVGVGVGVAAGNGENPVDAVRPGQGPAAVAGARFGTVPLLALPSDE